MGEFEIDVIDFSAFYGGRKILKNVNLSVRKRSITAVIGPSGCGKSTFLRSINRMNDYVPGFRAKGSIKVAGEDIYSENTNVIDLRKKVGMVFQKPTPFPKSIYDNVAYGPKIWGIRKKQELDEIVESSLKKAALWDEVKDKLRESACSLSGGQQQRLCIARAIAIQPEILLMDEPASALDPIATYKVEELIRELKELYTIVIVTHNMQEAARISDYTAFFLMGELVEYAPTAEIFTRPKKKETEDYISGRFG